MARTRRRRAVDPVPDTPHPEMEWVDIDDITPYENNPRNNAGAVESVANSIQAFGFNVPIVVDSDAVIVTGHTRLAAARRLGLTSVPIVRATHLSPEKAKQFRIADNKVSELATWNTDMLQDEFDAMREMGIDLQEFTGLGYTAEELDCLADVVEDDCLGATGFMSDEEQRRARQTQSRAPSQARIVISEFVFFVPIEAYRTWAQEVRRENDFDEQLIIEDLKERLGLDRHLDAE